MNEQEQEFLWNKCTIQDIAIAEGYSRPALNFYFDNGRVSIYRQGKDWVFSVWNNNDTFISARKFRDMLNIISGKRDDALKSMMNSNKISDRNAPTILAHMALKMAEHEKEIRNPAKFGENNDTSFFKSIKNPQWVNIMNNLHVIQYIEDDAPYVVGNATLLGLKIPDSNPLYTMDIAPPASGKSEWLKMMTPGMRPNIYTHPLSDLTSKSLISGVEGNEDLYPQLKNKLVVMEEFTNLITKDPTERAAIMGQIRTMYGGSLSKTFGSGVGTKSYNGNVGMLIGCTPMIDRIAAEMAVAGDKWIKVRRSFEIEDLIHEKIVDAAYENKISDPALIEGIQDEIFSLYEAFDPKNMPPIPHHITPYIKLCAHTTAFLRVSIDRDNYSKGKDITSRPVIEPGSRLVKVYVKLAQIIAWMLEKPEVDVEVLSYIYRVALDTPTANRVLILRKMGFMENQKTLNTLVEETRLAKNTVKIILEDLRVSDIVKEGTITIGKTSDGESIDVDSYYLNRDSILFGYISNVELFLDTLSPEQVHHNGMSETGIDMWKEANWTTPGTLSHDPSMLDDRGEDEKEPEHKIDVETHLKDRDTHEDEYDPSMFDDRGEDERKSETHKHIDPNAEEKEIEHTDPNVDQKEEPEHIDPNQEE